MASQYDYQPLDQSTNCIRLLRLLPEDGNDKFRNIPACQIFHTSLKASPKFVALSYVWGDSKDARIILVETRPVRVTTNLYNAMMALRPPNEPIIIWIDFICINQSDIEEKCWQVAQMGNIYRQAQKVIAWLGPADDSSDSVIDYLNEFGERADACGLAMGPEICMGLWQAMVTDPSAAMERQKNVNLAFNLFGRNNVSTNASLRLLHSIDGWHGQEKLLPVAGLKRLFCRPWWGRVWVLQEIALPWDAEFVCGTKRISRRRFSAAYNAYYALWEILAVQSQSQRRHELKQYHREVLFIVSHRPKLMLSMWRVHRSSNFPLLALLRATSVGSVHLLGSEGYQHLESTDPRDKIYALLGLANDQKDLERRGVFPNYDDPKDRVFMSVTAALLQQGHMAILSFCRTSEVPLGLPSWVPDWSQPMPATLQDVEPDHITLTPKFNASGVDTYVRNIVISRHGEAIKGISVACCVYDKICGVGDVPRVPVTGTCIREFDWLYELLLLTYKKTKPYTDFYHRLRAVVRTSVGGVTSGHDKLLERAKGRSLDARCLEALYILRQGVSNKMQRDIRSELKSDLANQKTADFIQNEAKESRGYLLMDYMRMSSGRSTFVTEKGHPGLSSRHVKRGDIVALVHGAQVPFILRRHTNGKYTIVSEAYVDGIMDGEAANDAVWENLAFV